jgi:hypothetical protein
MRSLLLIVMVLGLVGSAAVAQDRRGIRFWNLTLYTITNFQMSSVGQDIWGERCRNSPGGISQHRGDIAVLW